MTATAETLTVSSDLRAHRIDLPYNVLLDGKAATRSRIQVVLERVQNTNARFIAYNYKRIGSSLHRDIKAFDDIPDALTLAETVYRYDSLQSRILQDAYDRVASQVLPLVTGRDGTLKSLTDILSVKADDDISVDEAVFRMQVLDYINSQTGIHIQYIDETTLKQIQNFMRTSPTVADFQKAIDAYFRADWPSRSYTIARTESHNAAMASVDYSVRNTNVDRDKTKTWRISGSNTRPTHQAMDGVTVPFEDPFKVPTNYGGTDTMMFPGDTSRGAGAGNIINCRCWYTQAYAD